MAIMNCAICGEPEESRDSKEPYVCDECFMNEKYTLTVEAILEVQEGKEPKVPKIIYLYSSSAKSQKK